MIRTDRKLDTREVRIEKIGVMRVKKTRAEKALINAMAAKMMMRSKKGEICGVGERKMITSKPAERATAS